MRRFVGLLRVAGEEREVLPLAKIALKPRDFGNPEARGDAPLDFLAGLPTVFCERYLVRFGKP